MQRVDKIYFITLNKERIESLQKKFERLEREGVLLTKKIEKESPFAWSKIWNIFYVKKMNKAQRIT